MAKFRKRPVVIEAAQVSVLLWCASRDWDGLPQWVREAYEAHTILFEDNQISINTREGTMIGEYEDWVIRGVIGELYPCKPDIFEATYELVEQEIEA